MWADREEDCWSKEALTETLQEVLSDPDTGKVLMRLPTDKKSDEDVEE